MHRTDICVRFASSLTLHTRQREVEERSVRIVGIYHFTPRVSLSTLQSPSLSLSSPKSVLNVGRDLPRVCGVNAGSWASFEKARVPCCAAEARHARIRSRCPRTYICPIALSSMCRVVYQHTQVNHVKLTELCLHSLAEAMLGKGGGGEGGGKGGGRRRRRRRGRG